jgi:hypothetical protein
MFWPLSPRKIKLGCETVLRIDQLPKIKISGTGAMTDPILITPLDISMAKQLCVPLKAGWKNQLRGKDVPSELNIDWWKGVPWIFFDLFIEEHIFYKAIGLRGIDWEWFSRRLLVSGERILSHVQIRDLKTRQISTWYFDPTDLLSALTGEVGVKFSIACSNSMNRMFSVSEKLKEINTGAVGMIPIQANTTADVTNQIIGFLNQARDCEWKFGNAHFLNGGWRNEFYINKGEMKSVLVFDLRPTLKRIADIRALESASLMAFKAVVQAAAYEKEAATSERENSRNQIIKIESLSAVDAARQILRHLNAARAQGWTTGDAHVLIDGWRNEYHLTRNCEKSVLAFDLRPTFKYVRDALELTIATMAIAAPPQNIPEKYTSEQSGPLNN